MGRMSRIGASVVIVKWLGRVPSQWRRRLAVTSLVLALGVGVMLVLWVLPSVLTRDPHIADAADRHKAITDTRTGLVAALAAIGAAGGLAFTARTYRLSREGHITDRYSKAVEQLGDDKIEVRLGGIYALERLMRDSPSDQPTIMETLAAFVRQHAPRRSPQPVRPVRDRLVASLRRSKSTPASESPPEHHPPDHPTADIQAILTVLGRRKPVDNEGAIDLRATNLTGAFLKGKLPGTYLVGSDMTGAYLDKADLTGANLVQANLTGASITEANLTDARLVRANLTGASFVEANLTDASLIQANLTGAFLIGADLIGAQLTGANLTAASLTGARLNRGALSPEQLASALHVDVINWID